MKNFILTLALIRFVFLQFIFYFFISTVMQFRANFSICFFQIKETEEQVLELQKSLTLKSSELEAKKSAANAKLKVILSLW